MAMHYDRRIFEPLLCDVVINATYWPYLPGMAFRDVRRPVLSFDNWMEIYFRR